MAKISELSTDVLVIGAGPAGLPVAAQRPSGQPPGRRDPVPGVRGLGGAGVAAVPVTLGPAVAGPPASWAPTYVPTSDGD